MEAPTLDLVFVQTNLDVNPWVPSGTLQVQFVPYVAGRLSEANLGHVAALI
jgi:hypothetical protein